MKKILLVFILLVSASFVFALDPLCPDLELYNGVEFFRPLAYDSELVTRTSYFLQTDIVPLYFNAGNAYFGTGLSLQYTSHSLAYRYSVTKAYGAIGPVIRFDWRFSRDFMLGLRTRLMYGSFKPASLDKFSSLEASLVTSFRLVRSSGFKLDLISPLTVVLRKDGYAIRAGVGLSARIGE